mgnify:CR=1 FL=1
MKDVRIWLRVKLAEWNIKNKVLERIGDMMRMKT